MSDKLSSHDIIGCGWSFPPRVDSQGGLAISNEHNELDQAIIIILSTYPGQRVMRPTFGCRIHELIFTPNNSLTAAQAERYVAEALGMWEPRIHVNDVNARPDPQERSRLLIEINYRVNSTHNTRSLVFPFYLIPGD